MTCENKRPVPELSNKTRQASRRMTYWRSAANCFSIDYKGIITDICEGDLGYGEMNRLDGAIHAAIGCKRGKRHDCTLKRV